MQHISQGINTVRKKIFSSRQRFWKNNKDIFLRYFEGENSYLEASGYYDCLVEQGNFKRLEEIVKNKSNFKI